MKNSLLLAVFFTVIVLPFNSFSSNGEKGNPSDIKLPSATQDWMPCTVSDPTGTPLNVRAKPKGRIIAQLKNNTLVEIDDSTASNKWSRISFTKGGKTFRGWVLRAYLSCQ